MDKGLDIEVTRCVLALHAALYFKPKRLAVGIETLQRQDLAPGSIAKITEQLALRNRAVLAWDRADLALQWQSPSRRIIIRGSAEYPENLANIEDAPPVLFVDGNADALRCPQIGIVGSRNATPAGCETAFQLARDLCAKGFAITSGLARGIDAAAHRGALANGGQTLAVLGCGVDRIYPPTHAALTEQIAQSGALLSELPLGSPPLAQHFPRRNRIISGVSAGIVIVEANLSSGSLITAQLALEQGREVFAVPGSIRNPLTRGCHAMIRQGAHLVEGADDVAEALPRYVIPRHALPPEPLTKPLSTMNLIPQDIKEKIWQALGFEPVNTDLLVERSGLTMNRLSSILLEMELSGEVRSLPGGQYERSA